VPPVTAPTSAALSVIFRLYVAFGHPAWVSWATLCALHFCFPTVLTRISACSRFSRSPRAAHARPTHTTAGQRGLDSGRRCIAGVNCMIGWIQRTAASRSEAVVFTKCGRDSGAIPLLQVPGRTIAQQHIHCVSSFGRRPEFSNSPHEFTLQYTIHLKKKQSFPLPIHILM
jgi:hypothetical protein